MTTDERLAAELRQLARTVRMPTADIAAAVRVEIASRPQRGTGTGRLRPAVAVACLVIALAVLMAASPRARTAVAQLFGVVGIELGTDDGTVTPTVGDPLPMAEQVSLAAAQQAVGFPIGVPDALGAPHRVYLDESLAGGVVTLAWAPGDGLPEMRRSDVGALLSQFAGSPQEGLLRKLVGAGTTVEPVTVGGAPGVWVGGDAHVVVRDVNGEPREVRARLADHVLLWERDGVTMRLETALDRGAAVRLAESVR